MAHPGVSFNILKNVFSLNDSTLRYHLNYLEKTEKISFGLEKGRRHYYPHFGEHIIIRNTEDTTSIEPYEFTQIQKHILDTIKRYPGISQKELIKRTKINRLTLINNTNKLLDLCIVRKLPGDNSVCYEYIEDEQLRFEILKRLVIKLLKNEISEEKFLELKRKLE